MRAFITILAVLAIICFVAVGLVLDCGGASPPEAAAPR